MTDAFDLVFQLSGAALQRVLQAMHAHGTIRHKYLRHTAAGDVVQLGIGAPALSFGTSLSSDGRLHATATSRVTFHASPSAKRSDPGRSAVADVAVQAVLSLGAGDPASLLPSAQLAYDWSGTSAADITVTAPRRDRGLAREVRTTILSAIADVGSGTYALPPLLIGGDRVTSAAARFADGPGGPALSVGLNVGTQLKGSRAGIGQVFVSTDWALALAPAYLDALLSRALRASLGDLPGPRGTAAEVVLASSEICVIPNPFAGVFGPPCLGTATQQTVLARLDWSLGSGSITFSGRIRQRTNSFLVPPLTADFVVHATLSLARGGGIEIGFDRPQAQIEEWYGSLVDTLAGGALTHAVEAAIASTLGAFVENGGGGLLSDESLTAVTALGTAVDVGASATPTSVAITGDGVVLQGILTIAVPTRPLVAEFAAIPDPANPATLLLHAGETWAPGATVTELSWAFGDSSSSTTSANHLVTVAQHTYAAGSAQACLSVMDSLGRSTTLCRSLTPGRLVLERLSPPLDLGEGEWVVCSSHDPVDLTVKVVSNGAPIAGATVEAAGGGKSIQATTSTTGLARIAGFDHSWFTLPAGQTPLFLLGKMTLTATLPGYPAAQYDLWLKDCAAQRTWRDRIVGVHKTLGGFENRLLEQIEVALPNLRETGFVPDEPVLDLVRDATLTRDLLSQLVELASRTPDRDLLRVVLGAPGGKSGISTEALLTRLERVVAAAQAALEQRAQGLSGRPGRPDVGPR